MRKLSAVLASAAIATAALLALSGTASATSGMTHNNPTMTHNVSTMTHNAPSGYALAG